MALRTPSDVGRELARLYRAARSRALPSDEAARLAYLLVSLARIMEGAGFDERLAALERDANRNAGSPARPA